MRDLTLTFLGTGGSLGVPVIGCDCDVCSSTNPRNRRSRTSLLVEYGKRKILIDTAVDFREQALANGIRRIDAIVYTHAHADHILGLDDLRLLMAWRRKPMPMLANADTFRSLERMFGYVFQQKLWKGDGPRIEKREISGPFNLFGLSFTPVPVMHDKMEVLGFRFGGVAYVTDVSYIPEESWKLLQNLDLLIISAIRYSPHRKHMPADEVFGAIERLAPRQAIITHMSHELEHESFSKACPEGVMPAWDGLVVKP